MKAAVYARYGGPEVVELRDIPTPTPKDNEVRIRIFATTVSTGDWRARSLEMPPGFGALGRLIFGISKPRQPILGTDLAGVIDSVGKDVTTFQLGDEVFAFGDAGMGCHAEFRCIAANGLIAPKPKNLTFDEAAALPFGGMMMLNFFRRGELQRGERVLVNGASGCVGSAAVQLAKHFGAEVTGVCSTSNVELVRGLGAHQVVDYTREDFAKREASYDVIVDTVGNAPYVRSKHALTEHGRLLVVLGGLADLVFAPIVTIGSKHKVIAGPALSRVEDLQLLGEIAAAGAFKPVIDRSYPLDQIVEAHRRVDSGRKRGSVVVTVGR